MTGRRVARRTVLRAGVGLGAVAVLGLSACADPDDGEEGSVGEAERGATTPVPAPAAMVRTSWSEDPGRGAPTATCRSGRAPAGLLDPAWEAVHEAIAWSEVQEFDRSLADALDASGAAGAVAPALLAHVLRTELSTEYGADADELSAWWGTAEGSEGDDLLVTGGYGALVDHLPDGIDVRLAWPVTGVSRAGGTVAVVGPRGETLEADRAIVTVPLGVFQAGVVEFDPPLPANHRAAIEALGMGLLDKVWLRWDEPWWTESAQQWTRVGGPDDAFVGWFNLAAVTGEPVLLALVGGADARRWVGADDSAVLEAALASLQRFRDAGW